MAQGGTGEIWIKGEPGVTLMKGYYGNPEATREAIADGKWLRTGDLGFFGESGSLHFVDRIKKIIKCKGENISASEVEECIAGMAGVSEVSVIGIHDDVCGETPLAVIAPESFARLDAELVRAYCEQRLAHFKVPALYAFEEELPRTPTGKVDRRALSAKYDARKN